MSATLSAAESPVVASETGRGDEIQRRIDELGISDREFHDKTGIDRKTLRRAIDGEPRVRASTYAAIEAALDRLEAHVAGVPDVHPVGDPADDMIEFIIEGNLGVRAVVKGPVRDIGALEAAVAKLVRDMQSEGGNGTRDATGG